MSETEIKIAQRRRAEMKLAAYRDKLMRDLRTPEGAMLKLKLASAGERAGAVIIDIIFIIIIAICVLWALAILLSNFGEQGGRIVYAIAVVFFFVLRNFYFIVFEVGRRAATPGKRLLGLRVAARNGGRLTASAVFARNFIREVELFMPIMLLLFASVQNGVNAWLNLFGLIWCGLFLFFPLFNSDKLRAGDIIAGTWVIHTPKIELLSDVSSSGNSPTATKVREGFNFSQEHVNAYGIRELHVLEDILRKSSTEIKASVAERIRDKIGWTKAPGERDRAFLEAYYAALRKNLEQKLLLGQRKKDKFDKN